MPQHRDCDYCGDDIEPGTGTMFVRKNGSTIHYCSAKCEKNADLGREPRDLEWTEDGGAESEVTEE
jgi:large subunit ribosomal protein L24e